MTATGLKLELLYDFVQGFTGEKWQMLNSWMFGTMSRFTGATLYGFCKIGMHGESEVVRITRIMEGK